MKRKIAYLNPWGEHGENLVIKINGHTGLLATLGGGDYIPFNDIKDLHSFSILDTYDYLFVPFWGGFYDIIHRIRSSSKVRIVGVGDVELNAIPYAPRVELAKLVETARACDIFLTSNPDTLPLFSSIRSGHTYDITGWCIFPEMHRRVIIEPAKKDKNLISIGCSNSGYNRNILENFIAFKKLLVDFPDLKGFYWCVRPEDDNDILKIADVLSIPHNALQLMREYPYPSFLAQFSKMYASMHLYTFNVVSRMAQDAMALGIPHVGTYANYADREFCMVARQYDPVDGYEQMKRLLTNDKLYELVRIEQIEGVQNYESETIGKKIIGAIESFEKA